MGALSTLAGKSMALLVVKALTARVPFACPVRRHPSPTSPRPSWTVLACRIDLPGEPALKLAEEAPRVRSLAMYDWEDDGWKHNYFDSLDIMEISGPLLDGQNWTLVDTLYAPTADEARVRAVCTRSSGAALVSITAGAARRLLSRSAEHAAFEVKVRSIAPKPQTVTLCLRPIVVDTVTLSDQSWVTVKHAMPAPARPATHWLHCTSIHLGGPRGDARTLGVQTRDIIFTP